MQKTVTSMRVGLAIAVAALTSGCVEPAYVAPGPIQLQQYPPAVSYQSVPDYRPPVSGPIPLQTAPLIESLPPPTPAPLTTSDPTPPPTVTEVPSDDLGNVIPVQDMPTPAADGTNPAPDPAAPPQIQTVRKTPTSGPGSNVPLEGFRPMHGQTRLSP